MSGWVLFAWHAALVAVPALVSAACTAAWIGWARRRNIVDEPGQRRLHATATPRGGGVGIAVVSLAVLALLATVTWTPDAFPESERSVAMLLGAAFAALTGLADDLFATPSAFKFLGQMAAAAAIAWGLPWPEVDPAAGFALAFGWTLVLINFWNFMDGSDGLVAVQTLVVAVALACLTDGPGTLVAVVLAAACLGFLPFNLPKARVFMGDTGSHVLGAMVAILTLWALRWGQVNLGQVALLLSAFLIDAGLTLAKRIVQGRRFWQAHSEHLYQLAVRQGHSHLRVCLAYAGWAILAASIALWWGDRGAGEGAGAAMAVGLAGAVTWVVMRRHWSRRDTRMDAST